MAVTLGGCTRDPQVLKKRHVDKGDAYFQKEKYNEAAIEYANAVKIDPQYEQAHYKLAQTFLKQARWPYAFTELSRAVDLDPKDLNAQLDLAELYLAGDRIQDARSHAQAVLKIDPKNAQAVIVLSCADASDILPQALTEAQRAIDMDPTRAASYLNLANLQQRNKNVSGAEQNFQKAASIDPKLTPA